MIAASRKKGPEWVRDLVDGWMTPIDTDWYPDIKLLDVLMRMAPAFVTAHEQGTVVAGAQQKAADVLREIGRLAALGKLQVFGNAQNKDTLAVEVGQTRISEDFWRTGQIEYVDFINDTTGKAVRQHDGQQEIYVNIEFDSRQIRKLFPKAGCKRLKLQTPWKLE